MRQREACMRNKRNFPSFDIELPVYVEAMEIDIDGSACTGFVWGKHVKGS